MISILNKLANILKPREYKHYKFDGYNGQGMIVITNRSRNTHRSDIEAVSIIFQCQSFGSKYKYTETFGLYTNYFADDNNDTIGISIDQLTKANMELQKIYCKYPNAKFSVFGYNQGAMCAQYAVASLDDEQQQRLSGGYFYGGSNVYAILTKRQRDNVSTLNTKNRIFNYVSEISELDLEYENEIKTIGTKIHTTML